MLPENQVKCLDNTCHYFTSSDFLKKSGPVRCHDLIHLWIKAANKQLQIITTKNRPPLSKGNLRGKRGQNDRVSKYMLCRITAIMKLLKDVGLAWLRTVP